MPDLLARSEFPRSAKYHPDWIKATASGGANSLWLAEWLTSAMPLKPGMRVLDLGCGMAASSVFLHREFGVHVWATDLWFSADLNARRVKDAGAEQGVLPVHANARELPFEAEFFDAIVSIDAFMYYGTDDLYLASLARLLKPNGFLGIASSGLMHELVEVPAHLASWWEPALWCLHSAPWWKQHWERSGTVRVELADTMPNGWQRWLDWQRVMAPHNAPEIQAIETDAGRNLGYIRVVARRNEHISLDPPLASIPMEYVRAPLLKE